MAIEIIDGLSVFKNVPADDRRVVSDITARNALNTNYRYIGLKTFVQSENKEYQLQGGVANANWVDVTGGAIGQTGSTSVFIQDEGTYAITTVSGTNTATGTYSFVAGGNGNTASGNFSHAQGSGTTASGPYSHSEGLGTSATTSSAHAEGRYTLASGSFGSHAEGRDTVASGNFGSHAEGRSTTASNNYAHAEGFNTTASGIGSHAQGNSTRATGSWAHSEGQSTLASGNFSHAGGEQASATTSVAFTHGQNTLASGQVSFSIGSFNEASGDNSVASGRFSNSEGTYSFIHSVESTVESFIGVVLGGRGNRLNSNASGSTILGGTGITGTSANTVYGVDFSVQGDLYSGGTNLNSVFAPIGITQSPFKAGTGVDSITTVSGSNVASGELSFAVGDGNTASNNFSFASGYNTQSNGRQSHSEGYVTTANTFASHAEGGLTFANGYFSHAEGLNTTASGQSSHAEGNGTFARDNSAHAEGNNTRAYGAYSHAEGISTSAVTSGSHAEGNATQAYGAGSHSEGSSTIASGSAAHAEGINTEVYGVGAHAEGNSTNALADSAHAEGLSTTASGNASHSQGISTTASGAYSHAEGNNTTASGSASHAEGLSTQANGNNSHAQGLSTQANGTSSHAGGLSSIAGADQSFVHATLGVTEAGANNSAILGGRNNTLESTAIRSVILGGNNITGTEEDTVYGIHLSMSGSVSADTFYSGSTDIGDIFALQADENSFVNGIFNISGNTYGLGGDIVQDTLLSGNTKTFKLGTADNPFGYVEHMSNDGIFIANSVASGGTGFGNFIDIRSYSNDYALDTATMVFIAGHAETGDVFGVPVVPHDGQMSFTTIAKDADQNNQLILRGSTGETRGVSLRTRDQGNSLFTSIDIWNSVSGVTIEDSIHNMGINYVDRNIDESGVTWSTHNNHIPSIGMIKENLANNGVVVTGSTYTAATSAKIVSITASGSTISLPANPDNWTEFIIKDSSGDAGANNITVNVVGGSNTIDGLGADTIQENYASARYMFNGIEYMVL